MPWHVYCYSIFLATSYYLLIVFYLFSQLCNFSRWCFGNLVHIAIIRCFQLDNVKDLCWVTFFFYLLCYLCQVEFCRYSCPIHVLISDPHAARASSMILELNRQWRQNVIYLVIILGNQYLSIIHGSVFSTNKWHISSRFAWNICQRQFMGTKFLTD